MTGVAVEPDAPVVSDEPHGPWFWSGLVVGWAVIGFGVWGALGDAERTNPPGLVTWLLGGLLVHDLVVAPVATAVVLLLDRRAHRWWRGPVLVAAAFTALIGLFSYPLVRGFGRRDTNPSALPHDYPVVVLAVIGVIWTVAAVVLLIRRRSR